MGYLDGIELANYRIDAMTQARCDPKKGWKREGNKCVRNQGKMRQGGNLGKVALAAGAVGLGVAGLAYAKKKNKEAEQSRQQISSAQKKLKGLGNAPNPNHPVVQGSRDLNRVEQSLNASEEKFKSNTETAKKIKEAQKIIDEMAGKKNLSDKETKGMRGLKRAKTKKGLEQSVKLAKSLGVKDKDILKNTKDIDKFMTE